MKIREFIEKDFNTQEEFETILVRKYIPIQEKRMIARDILDRCIDDTDGFITFDEIDKGIYCVTQALSAYCDLEFNSDYEALISEYDALCEYKYKNEYPVLDVFTILIGDDLKKLKKVIDKEQDAILKRNCIEAQVAKVANALVSTVDELDVNKIVPDGTNMLEILEMLKKFN